MAGRSARSRSGTTLTLFVGGRTPNSLTAQTMVEACLAAVPEAGAGTRLRIIDVEADPQSTSNHAILATPTLLVEHAGRTFRLVGDLSRGEQLQDLLRAAAVTAD